MKLILVVYLVFIAAPMMFGATLVNDSGLFQLLFFGAAFSSIALVIVLLAVERRL